MQAPTKHGAWPAAGALLLLILALCPSCEWRSQSTNNMAAVCVLLRMIEVYERQGSVFHTHRRRLLSAEAR